MANPIPRYEYNSTSEAVGNRSVKWWTLKEDEIGQGVYARVKHINDRQSYRQAFNERHARLYSNMEFAALSAGRYNEINVNRLPQNRVTWNVIKACVDTAAAKISKNKPLPLFLTQKGAWQQKHRAELLTQYIEGLFDESKTFVKGQQAFTHACVYGTGAMKSFVKDGQVTNDWVFIHEILVDDIEAYYGSPRSIYHWTTRSREIVMDQYGENAIKKELIRSAGAADKANMPFASEQGDVIELIEAWHLPSSENAKDGRHVIALPNGALVNEEYKKDYFPITFFKWSEPIVGFYGMGIPWELEGIQVEINKLLRDISQAQHIMGVPRIWIENGSNIQKPITNEIGMIGRYSGTAPQFQTYPSMAPDIYQHVNLLWQRAFEQIGVSQLSATSKKPGGLNSGAALREYNDIETERFILVGQRWENFFMEIAKKDIDMSRDLYADNPDLMMKSKGGKFLKQIEWKDVDLGEDEYVMEVFPTSFLRSTPSGKLEDINDLIKLGVIDNSRAASLLDFPDLKKYISLETASYEVAQMMIDEMLETGEYQAPEPYMDLAGTLKMAQNAYLQSKIDGAPEENRQLLQNFMQQCKDMLDEANAAANATNLPQTIAPAQPEAPGEQAAGVPGAPPGAGAPPMNGAAPVPQ